MLGINWTAVVIVVALLPLLAIGSLGFFVYALDWVVHLEARRDGEEV